MAQEHPEVQDAEPVGRKDLSARQAAAILVGVWLLLFAEFLWVTYEYHHGIGIWGNDAQEYYAWIRSLSLDGDVDFENEYTDYDYSNTVANWLLNTRTPKGLHTNATGIGCSLCWSPFFGLACLISWVTALPVDGFNPVFQFLVPFGSILYGGVAICLIYRICRLRFDRWASVLGTAGVFLGTTLTFLFSHLPMLSHLPAVAVTAAFLLIALKTAEHRSLRHWIGLGALLALVTMIRLPMAILAIVFPIQSVLRILRDARAEWPGCCRQEMLGWLVAATTAFVLFLPQLVAWKALFGSFLASYVEPTKIFDWSCPNFFSALFSWNHGVVVWTPIVGLALVGLVASAVSRLSAQSLPLLGYTLALCYVVGCCAWWNFPEVYGNRGFSEASPAFAFGLAFLWHKWRKIALALTVLAIVQNHLLIWAYQNDYVQKVTGYGDILNGYIQIITHVFGKILRLAGLG